MKKAMYFIITGDNKYLKSFENNEVEFTENLLEAKLLTFDGSSEMMPKVELVSKRLCTQEPVEGTYMIISKSKGFFKELNTLNRAVFTKNSKDSTRIPFEEITDVIELLEFYGYTDIAVY